MNAADIWTSTATLAGKVERRLMTSPLASLLSVDFSLQQGVLFHTCNLVLQTLSHLEPWSQFFAFVESWAKLLTMGWKLFLHLFFILDHGESFIILLLKISWFRILVLFRLDNSCRSCLLGCLQSDWSCWPVLDLLNLRLKVYAFYHRVSLLAGQALSQLFLVQDYSTTWPWGATTPLRKVVFVRDVLWISDEPNHKALILWFEPPSHLMVCVGFILKLFELVSR